MSEEPSRREMEWVLENQAIILVRLEEVLEILREFRGALERLRANPVLGKWV